jgi:hypothetical protein
MSLRRLWMLALVPVLALAFLAGCSDDSDSGDGDDGGSAESDSTGAEDGSGVDVSGLPAFDTITALNDVLTGAGIACALEYEGLVDDTGKEVSICVIDGQQAQLTVYPDSTTVEALVAADTSIGALAYGQNWTVQVDQAATAEAIATALGGAAISAEAPATDSTLAPTTVAP